MYCYIILVCFFLVTYICAPGCMFEHAHSHIFMPQSSILSSESQTHVGNCQVVQLSLFAQNWWLPGCQTFSETILGQLPIGWPIHTFNLASTKLKLFPSPNSYLFNGLILRNADIFQSMWPRQELTTNSWDIPLPLSLSNSQFGTKFWSSLSG